MRSLLTDPRYVIEEREGMELLVLPDVKNAAGERVSVRFQVNMPEARDVVIAQALKEAQRFATEHADEVVGSVAED